MGERRVEACDVVAPRGLVDLCTFALTSAHHAAARAFAAGRSAKTFDAMKDSSIAAPSCRACSSSSGSGRSSLPYPTRFSTRPLDCGSSASQKSGRNR